MDYWAMPFVCDLTESSLPFEHNENYFTSQERSDIASHVYPVDLMETSFLSLMSMPESSLTDTFDISAVDSIKGMDFYIEDDYLQDFNSYDPWSVHNLQDDLGGEFQSLTHESNCMKSVQNHTTNMLSIRTSCRKKHYSTSDIQGEKLFVTSCTQTDSDNVDCDSFFSGILFPDPQADLQIAFDCSLSDDSIYIVDTSTSHWCFSEDLTNAATTGSFLNPDQHTEHIFLFCRENQLIPNTSACSSSYTDPEVHSLDCVDFDLQQHKYCDKWKSLGNSGFMVKLNQSCCYNTDKIPLIMNMTCYQEETSTLENIGNSDITIYKHNGFDTVQSCADPAIHCTLTMLHTSLPLTMNRKHHRKKLDCDIYCECFSVEDFDLNDKLNLVTNDATCLPHGLNCSRFDL